MKTYPTTVENALQAAGDPAPRAGPSSPATNPLREGPYKAETYPARAEEGFIVVEL